MPRWQRGQNRAEICDAIVFKKRAISIHVAIASNDHSTQATAYIKAAVPFLYVLQKHVAKLLVNNIL